MKNKLFLWMVLTVVFLAGSHAQVNTAALSNAEDLTAPVYGLGLAAGWGSGLGLSFRCHLPSKSSLQVVFGIIKTADKLSADIGGEYQYDLVRSLSSRFFVVSTISYFYHGDKTNEVAGPFRMGAGIGGEFPIQDALHISVEGVFVFFSDGRVIPLPQLAAHYYFF